MIYTRIQCGWGFTDSVSDVFLPNHDTVYKAFGLATMKITSVC